MVAYHKEEDFLSEKLAQVGVTLTKAKPGTIDITMEHIIHETPSRELLSQEKGARYYEAPNDAPDERLVTVTFKINSRDILV